MRNWRLIVAIDIFFLVKKKLDNQSIMKCCGTSNKLHMKECEFLNEVGENEEFL
jgi:hypothetical protein